MTTDIKLTPSSVAAFTEALWGDSGSLDAWLEVNDESEVAAHIEAYASGCVSRATAEKDAEIEALRAERDELLEALQLLFNAAYFGFATSVEFGRAEAAIAKARGSREKDSGFWPEMPKNGGPDWTGFDG